MRRERQYLQLLDLPGQRRVSADVLEERRLESDPQVGFLPVAVFLTETTGNMADPGTNVFRVSIHSWKMINSRRKGEKAAALDSLRPSPGCTL